MSIILKNIHTTDIFISDLGEKKVPFGGQLNIGTLYPFELIVDSLDIKQLINEDKIIVNDGVSDLNKIQSLQAVDFASAYNVTEVSIVAIASGNSIINHIFQHKDKDYIDTEEESYKTVASVIFPGTNNINPTSFKAITSTDDDGAAGELRIFDISNGNELGNITWTSENKIITSGTLQNLSSTEAIWEIQMRSTSGDDKIRLHYLITE